MELSLDYRPAPSFLKFRNKIIFSQKEKCFYKKIIKKKYGKPSLHSRFVPRSGLTTASMRFARCTSLSHILLILRKTSHRSKRCDEIHSFRSALLRFIRNSVAMVCGSL